MKKLFYLLLILTFGVFGVSSSWCQATTDVYDYTGNVVSWNVPANVTEVEVKVWGAGGGGGSNSATGGAGSYVTGTINVTSISTLYIQVGKGGNKQTGNNGNAGGYPGGGSGRAYAAGGGGYSGIFNGSTPSQVNALMIAGAGGGGGNVIGGGNNYIGKGGNQSGQSGGGSALQGSNGTGSQRGGGGGGYVGGSAGANDWYGGRGGTSYVNATYVSNSSIVAGNQGSTTGPAGSPAGVAGGGGGNNGSNGNDGRITISYTVPQPKPDVIADVDLSTSLCEGEATTVTIKVENSDGEEVNENADKYAIQYRWDNGTWSYAEDVNNNTIYIHTISQGGQATINFDVTPNFQSANSTLYVRVVDALNGNTVVAPQKFKGNIVVDDCSVELPDQINSIIVAPPVCATTQTLVTVNVQNTAGEAVLTNTDFEIQYSVGGGAWVSLNPPLYASNIPANTNKDFSFYVTFNTPIVAPGTTVSVRIVDGTDNNAVIVSDTKSGIIVEDCPQIPNQINSISLNPDDPCVGIESEITINLQNENGLAVPNNTDYEIQYSVNGVTWSSLSPAVYASGIPANGNKNFSFYITFTSPTNSIQIRVIDTSDGDAVIVSKEESVMIEDCPMYTQIFDYTGSDQDWVVPDCVSEIVVRAWGAGGGGGGSASGNGMSHGGGGAFIEATLPVIPGSTLKIVVGESGRKGTTGGLQGAATYGGGGKGGNSSGSGGGLSGVFISSVSQANALVIAGGGGGGANDFGSNQESGRGGSNPSYFGGGSSLQGADGVNGSGGGAGGGGGGFYGGSASTAHVGGYGGESYVFGGGILELLAYGFNGNQGSVIPSAFPPEDYQNASRGGSRNHDGQHGLVIIGYQPCSIHDPMDGDGGGQEYASLSNVDDASECYCDGLNTVPSNITVQVQDPDWLGAQWFETSPYNIYAKMEHVHEDDIVTVISDPGGSCFNQDAYFVITQGNSPHGPVVACGYAPLIFEAPATDIYYFHQYENNECLGSNTDICNSIFFGTSPSPIFPEPLPVELLSFYGMSKGRNNLLSWTTASEKNNDFFELQSSKDGKEFSTIAIVKGAGNSTNAHSYEVTDKNIPNIVMYYRLKQVDFSGEETYLGTISIHRDGEGSNMHLYPNPTKDALHVNVNVETSGDYVFEFSDISGKSISFNYILKKGTNLINIHLNDYLSRGFYILSIIDKNGKTIEKSKFIKE